MTEYIDPSGKSRPPQLSREDLRGLGHEQIERARALGQLDDLLAGKTEPERDAEGRITRAGLRGLAPEEIVRLHESGQLRHLLDPNRRYSE
ncbi:MAG: hypothetical protein H6525_07400 [Actinobacteria bacterium]|nr:hypothetical protein [Actinomycetota bacterium]MCB9412654.1 hypothetical protein [Actinomycetota bacterium]